MADNKRVTSLNMYIVPPFKDTGLPITPLAKFLEDRNEATTKGTALDALALDWRIVAIPHNADFWVLPHPWNTYSTRVRTRELRTILDKCYEEKRYLIVWVNGDYEAIVPYHNVIQFQNGLHRSTNRKPRFAFELPAFWPDYLKIYFNGVPQIRRKSPKPVVGFCGQAASTLPKLALVAARNTIGHMSYAVGTARHIPPPVIPSTVLRSRVLRTFSKSSAVVTNFIIRDRYRAGVRSKVDRDNHFHPSKVEFVNNIIESDYTVCVRGGGNFSVRLYETLSCGRIPIFIDTDARLPFDFLLDWKQYCVWIPQSEIKYAAEKVADFHANLTDDDFVEMQLKCRQLWEQWLSRDTFLSHFHEHLLYVLNKAGELPNMEMRQL